METRSFLGTGLKYPIEIDSFGKTALVSDIENVQQAIWDILITPKGSRFMLSNYGSELYLLIEKPMYIVSGLIRVYIERALRQEKRIKFLNLTQTTQGRRIDCDITYQILQTNQTESLIFPFFTNF